MELTLLLGGVLLLIVIAAFFVATETAMIAASRAKLAALEAGGNAGAREANQLLATPERIVATALFGGQFARLLASSLVTTASVGVFGPIAVFYAALGMTVAIVVFSDVLPKTYAIAYADRIAVLAAPILRASVAALRPFTAAIELVVRQLLRLTPSKRDDEANILAAHNEIRGTIELQTKEGAVARHDAEMLGGVLDLRELQVLDIMVHRTKMETINADDPPEKIVADVVKSQFSRVPIWKDEPENIIGVLHTKDMLAALAKTGWNASRIALKGIAGEPWFVPDTTTVKDQLNAFLKRKAQLALVVDEYGEVQGLITLEDILEEIVGQISDEHDTEAQAIRVQPDGTVAVDGGVPIRDLNRHMNWSLPDDEATTIAGLVIHEAQAIPEPGHAFTFYGYRFEILRKSRNKITALRIRTAGSMPPGRQPGDADVLRDG